MMLQSTWPFSLFFSTPTLPAHQVELKVLPATKVKAIKAQDARDAQLYQDIESHCETLRGVREELASRRSKDPK